MAKKKDLYDEEIDETQQEAEAAPVVAEVYFTRVMWKDVKEVFKCSKCGTDRDDLDGMIEHVLTHYPLEMQEDILEILLKEK